ncbi:hypothetical protein ACGF5M_02410 [Gemmatimonadota bacterium]
MSKAGGSQDLNGKGTESEAVLQAKYLDYCSAQVADILLLLTPDEMYTLAQDAAGESGEADDVTYDDIVRLATARILKKLALPPFESWCEEYLESPEKYEHEFLGLWESDIEGVPDG